MDFDQVLYSRRAVRDYTRQPVSEASLRRLIDAAIQAPSATNEQPWIFSVLRERAQLARISEAAKAHMLARPPAGVVLGHLHQVVENPEFDLLYGAPALIVISSATHSHWAAENCALAAENLMLAARADGLGTCWIGFIQTWLGTPEGKATIKVPADALPVAPIIVGHPRAEPAAVSRKPPEIVWV
jgi:nitroreductase